MKTATKETRSERTRRLIQIGALTEKYFNIGGAASIEAEEVLKAMVNHLKDSKGCYPADFESAQELVEWLKK